MGAVGKLQIVGIGPGDARNMTASCRDSLQGADVIAGYKGYTDLLKPLFPDKRFYETGMTQEVERCRTAINLARDGKKVCLVSGGDSGVYGIACLVCELAEESPDLEIEIIPGVTAAVGGAALLGAPLGADFAVVSLSDLLTPWGIIEKRLRAAASGDFAICLYNPGSKKRTGHLRAACDILLELLPPDRLCGITRNIGRKGQSVLLTTLSQLRESQAGMEETIFIGNSGTREIKGRLVTPRGYGKDRVGYK